MTITRVRPAGWPFSSELEAAEITELDLRNSYSLDKTSAGDTLSGVIQTSGVGRVVDSVVTGANANTSYPVGTASVIVIPSSLTGDRVYTFPSTGAVVGDKITITCAAALTYSVEIVDGVTSNSLIILSPNTATYGTYNTWCVIMYTASGWVLRETSARRSNVRFYLTTAGLKAETDYYYGDVAVVLNYGTFYYYNGYGATLADTLHLLKPDNVLLANNGRWLKSDPLSYAKVVTQGSGNNAILMNVGGGIMDSTTLTATSERGSGATLRLAFRFYANFTARYTAIPANVETGIDYYITVQEGAGTVVTSDTFHIGLASQYQNDIAMDRGGTGFIECVLPDGSGTYTVRLYAGRVDAGGTLVYSQFEDWTWEYQVIETP